jgi:hypothetical protein
MCWPGNCPIWKFNAPITGSPYVPPISEHSEQLFCAKVHKSAKCDFLTMCRIVNVYAGKMRFYADPRNRSCGFNSRHAHHFHFRSMSPRCFAAGPAHSILMVIGVF